ncbi:MAG: LysM peptidoglycan-binding domain-containing protein [Thermotogota bacterium]
MKKILFLLLALTMTIFVFSTNIFYTVEFENTLYSISRKLNIPLKTLTESNELSEPYTIKPGQKLKITEYQAQDFKFITNKIRNRNEIIELYFNHYYKIAHHNFDYEIREKFMYNFIKILYENEYYEVADNTLNLVVDKNYKQKTLLLKFFKEIKKNNVHETINQLNSIKDKEIVRNLKYTLSESLIKSRYKDLALDFRNQTKNEKVNRITLEDSSYKSNDYFLITTLINNKEYENAFEIFSNYILTEDISPKKLLTTMDILILLLKNEEIINNYNEDLNNLLVISWLMI